MLKQTIADAHFALSAHQDEVYEGGEKTIVGIEGVAVVSAAVVAPEYVIPGFFIGGGLGAARQGVQIAEGSRTSFSGREVFDSGVVGGILAPLAVGAPVIGYGLSGLGVYSAAGEFSQGHGWTGAFDLATAALPFASKRAPAIGRWARPRVAAVTMRVGMAVGDAGLGGRPAPMFNLPNEPSISLVLDARGEPLGVRPAPVERAPALGTGRAVPAPPPRSPGVGQGVNVGNQPYQPLQLPVPPPTGRIIVDLQGGPTVTPKGPSFLLDRVQQTPGAAGVNIEGGDYVLSYQGIKPTGPRDLAFSRMLVQNLPEWPSGPGLSTDWPQWRFDPHVRFPKSGPVTVLQNPALPGQTPTPQVFFPPVSRSGAAMPTNLSDVAGLTPTEHPQLYGRVDEAYWRRGFGIGRADPETATALGGQFNRMLKPGGFAEIRALVSRDVQVVRQAAQAMPGARIVEVPQSAIKSYAASLEAGADVRPNGLSDEQWSILQAAGPDIQGAHGALGEGVFNRIIRIYKPQISESSPPAGFEGAEVDTIPADEASAAPKLLPAWQGPPVRTTAPGMSAGEAAEAAALRPMRANATLLPEKAGGYDAHIGGTKILNEEVNTTDLRRETRSLFAILRSRPRMTPFRSRLCLESTSMAEHRASQC